MLHEVIPENVIHFGEEIHRDDLSGEWTWSIYRDYQHCKNVDSPDKFLAIGDGFTGLKFDVTFWEGDFRVFKYQTAIVILFWVWGNHLDFNEKYPHGAIYAVIPRSPVIRD